MKQTTETQGENRHTQTEDFRTSPQSRIDPGTSLVKATEDLK